jgi:drug/metabolite transporter (DMT)-like permease
MFRNNAYVQLHFSILIFGFTVILGKVINLSEFWLVWYRLGLASLAYLFFIKPHQFKISKQDALKLAGGGLLLTLHWITFFGSIKYANASIGAVCLSTSMIFAALLEPFFYRKRLKWYQIALGMVVVTGIYLIHRFHEVYTLGLIIGLTSAFLSAIWSIVNKKIVEGFNNTVVNFYELGFGWLILTVLSPFVISFEGAFPLPSLSDWVYLLILSLICTNFAYNLSINSLRSIPTFNYVLAFNMETIYGIILATLLFGENTHTDTGTIIGVMMVLVSVFAYPFLHRYIEMREAKRISA